MIAAITATTIALTAMLPYREARASLTRVRGTAVRTIVVSRPSSVTGTATYIMSCRSVSLYRIASPGLPSKAVRNSGRVAWFSISVGFESESASTSPLAAPGLSAAMIVMRVPDALPSRCTSASSCCGVSAVMAGRTCSRTRAARAWSSRSVWSR